MLGNGMGGLSGPAIKPIALRAVYQVARAVKFRWWASAASPRSTTCMEFLVAGATAVQIGTANFYRPGVAVEILDALPAALAELGAAASPKWSARCEAGLTDECAKDSPPHPSRETDPILDQSADHIHARSFRHSTHGPIPLGQLLRRHPAVHRLAGQATTPSTSSPTCTP